MSHSMTCHLKFIWLSAIVLLAIATPLPAQPFTLVDPGYGHRASTGPDLSSLGMTNILYLKLDDASGTNMIDSSTNSVALGQVVNGAIWTNGTPALGDSGSLWFDGVNDYGMITNVDKIYITNVFSIAFWLQMDTTSQSSIYWLSMRDNVDDVFAFAFGFTANKLQFYSGRFSGSDPGMFWPSTITDTLWHHYALTYDGTTLRGYYDGSEVTNRTVSFSLSNTIPANQRLRLATSTGAANFLKGKINAYIMWRKVLSASEISLLQNSQGPT